MGDENPNCVVEFTFGKSSSQMYHRAVNIAKAFASYANRGTEQKPMHSIRERLSSSADVAILDKLRLLIEIAQNWKSASLEIHNYKSQNFYELHTELQSVIQCESIRENHPLADDYCRGMKLPSDPPAVFGCRFAVGVRRSTDRADSISYRDPGHLAAASDPWWKYTTETADVDVYLVQKDVIRLALLESTKGHVCRSCKFFSASRLEQDIEALPSKLDVSSSDELYSVEYNDLGSVRRRVERKYSYEPMRLSLSGGELETKTSSDIARSVPSLSLDNVAINAEILDRVRDTLILPILHPDYYAALGASVSHGILLYGPPGNGKTLLAEAVAGEVGAHFIRMDGPEVLSPWVGKSEENIRAAFLEARRLAPTVLFIDEIDSIAPARSSTMQQHNNQLVAQLLTLLDDGAESVWVFGSTNRIEALDPAILRPGRFDHHVFIDRPNQESILKILMLNLDVNHLEEEVDLMQLASRLDGMSGAELVSVCKLAKQSAIKDALALQIKPADVRIARADFDMAINHLNTTTK